MRKLWRGLNYTVCMLVVILTMLALVFGLRAVVGYESEISRIMPFFLLIGLLLWAWERMITIARKKYLSFSKIPVLKPGNFLTLLVIFNASFLITCYGAVGIVKALSEDGGNTVVVIGRIVVFLAGALFLLTLLTDIPFIGVKNYVSVFIHFFKSCIGVFFLYQILFSLLSFICSMIVILISRAQSGAELTAAGFMFVVSGEIGANGLQLSAGSIFSSLAAASTYFALTDMAYDFLKEGQMPPFKQQLKKMFFDTDTRFLLIMTVLSVVFMLITKVASGPIYTIIFLVFLAAFAFSFFVFVKQKFIMFLINFTVMSLIEMAIPLPELSGFLSAFPVIGCFAVRTLLFSVVALLCGYMYYIKDLNQEGNASFVQRAFDVSILQVGAVAIWAMTNPKESAAAAMQAASRTEKK